MIIFSPMKTNTRQTPLSRTGLLGWMLLAIVVGLAAFPFVAHAADASTNAAQLSTSPAVAAPTVTPQADGSLVVTGIPPAWEAIWLRVLSIAGTVVLVAKAIVKITPTPKDDTILDSVITFLKHLGLSTPPDKPNP
jgi:hypothetical protein